MIFLMMETHTIVLVKTIFKVFYFILLSKEVFSVVEYDDIVMKFYEHRKDWETSNLGTYLFKNIGLDSEPRFQAKERTFFILQWLAWGYGEVQSVYHLKYQTDPLKGCSVRNCLFSDDSNDLDMADAVVVNVRHVGPFLPPSASRNPSQLWVWMSEESPVYNNISSQLPSLANIYNWSMSYRTDSEIPMPYGRVIPLPMKLIDDVKNEDYMAELVPNWETKKRDVYVAILMSHCTSKYRMKYVETLQKYIDVDFYGACSNDKNKQCLCYDPSKFYFKQDCPLLKSYLFYLDFENSRCRQYLTEKVYHHAFSMGAIPIIMGPPKEDCKRLLPPDSFLHVDNYESPIELAEHIKRIVTYNDTILWYHRWRNYFIIENEHGYFDTQSMVLCRICEALNYNVIKSQTYTEDDLRLFLDERILCLPPYEGREEI